MFQIRVHKLQSSEGVPNLQLALVPKMLMPLVRHWVTEAFVVSFKLETDQDLLVNKARYYILDMYAISKPVTVQFKKKISECLFI